MINKEEIENTCRYRLQTATGENVDVLGECELMVTIGDEKFRQVFLVAPITDECILGLDFMARHRITLDLHMQILKWSNTEVPLELNYTDDVKLRLMVADAVKIPPRSEIIISARLNRDPGGYRVGMIEPNLINKRGVICARTLVQLKSSTVPVRIMNINQEEQTIRKGVLLGEIEPISRITSCYQNKKSQTTKDAARRKIIENLCSHLPEPSYQYALSALQPLADVFAVNDQDMGSTNIVQHHIHTEGHHPIKQPPRRLPLAKKQVADELITQMQQDGIIEPSNSPWSSPVVLVQKKDGSTRFCVDYRKLNEVTKKDSYPLPRIDDTLDTLAGAKLFSTLDLKSGYWQVKIKEEDREKTAFSTGTGLYQFIVMPFGLCNAPATFERLMEQVLRGLTWKICLVYLDDIIVFGSTFEEHIKNLQEVLQLIRSAGLKLSPNKCSLFKDEVNYLGHIVSSKGVRTDPSKLNAVRNWPTPKNVHDVRSFMGLCSYYRRFVPNFADTAHWIQKLTEKNREFTWKQEQQKAFEQLKEKLCSAPILAYPRANEMFILDADASNHGIGAVLSQLQDNEEHVIAYFSRSLSKPEKNYCITRKELLAIVDSIKHFHKYLYGQKFLLRTDHAALKWLMQFKEPEGQVARWIERLQAYDFNIEHRKGRLHNNADSLSRRPCQIECKQCNHVEAKNYNERVTRIAIQPEERWENDKLREAQQEDESIAPVIMWLEKGQRPQWQEISTMSPIVKSYWAQFDSLALEDGILLRKWESEDGKIITPQIILPCSRIPEVLEEMHNGRSGAHLGINKTLAKIRTRFYWINCRRDVEDWCRKCVSCAASKGPQRRTMGKMQQYNVGAPFERIAMDIAGPFPITTSGNRYILVCIDYFSKWVEAFAIPNQEARTVAETFVNNWVCRYGAPMELHTDQGRNFESSLFQEVCRMLNIRKTRTTPLHPQSDGMVERFNRTLEEFLRKEVNANQDNWDQCLPLLVMGYRSAVHDTTGYSPAMVLFGRELQLPCDIRFGIRKDQSTKDEYVEEVRERMAKVHEAVRNHIVVASDRMKTRYDLRANNGGFTTGESVWLYNPTRRKGKSPKLQNSWEGPYKVIKRLNDVVYRIQRNPKCKMKIVHVDRLTKYHGEDENSVRDEQI